MADLFKALKPKVHLSKNGFDLSRKHVFSSQAGMALPCLAVETVPNDYFEIGLAALSRTQTFNTAAFLRGKQRYDFFFVPYTQLWHPFNQFISQRTDKHSTNQKGHIFAPVVSLGMILRFIWSSFNESDSSGRADRRDFMNYELVDNYIRILDLLGYGDFRWIKEIDYQDFPTVVSGYDDKYVNVFRLAAYQHIWYDYYRNKFYDVDDTGGISADTTPSDFRDYIFGFNFDDIDCVSFSSSIIVPFSANFDWASNQPSVPSNQYTSRMFNLLKLNYIQWKKDLFTSALPSQQFGSVSSIDLTGLTLEGNASLNGVTGTDGSRWTLTNGSSLGSSKPVISNVAGNTLAIQNQSSAVHTHTISGSATISTSASIPGAFDVLQLRKAEALQSWKQATLRAGNMTDSSFQAHFGTDPYYEGDENVRYLGSFSSVLQVNAVETTAQSNIGGNNRVGDLAATGTIVTNGSKIKFDVKDFGIIMCIASYLPESEYTSNALDKANTLHEQFDWFTPEFQNIGLEAIQRHEYDFSGQDSSVNDVLGYAPRYYMYKSAVDKVYGEFKDSFSLDVQNRHASAFGSLEGWVSPRIEWSASSRLLRTFYVDPRLYDNVMAINATSDQITDYFLNNVFFDIKAIRPMSVLGLPQF